MRPIAPLDRGVQQTTAPGRPHVVLPSHRRTARAHVRGTPAAIASSTTCFTQRVQSRRLATPLQSQRAATRARRSSICNWSGQPGLVQAAPADPREALTSNAAEKRIARRMPRPVARRGYRAPRTITVMPVPVALAADDRSP